MWNPFKRSADTLLTASDKQMLVEAIQLAEKNTSGEIRVFVESKLGKLDALTRAKEIFFKNKMNDFNYTLFAFVPELHLLVLFVRSY